MQETIKSIHYTTQSQLQTTENDDHFFMHECWVANSLFSITMHILWNYNIMMHSWCLHAFYYSKIKLKECLIHSLFLVPKKENMKAPYYWALLSIIHSILLVSPHKGPVMWKAFLCHYISMLHYHEMPAALHAISCHLNVYYGMEIIDIEPLTLRWYYWNIE